MLMVVLLGCSSEHDFLFQLLQWWWFSSQTVWDTPKRLGSNCQQERDGLGLFLPDSFSVCLSLCLSWYNRQVRDFPGSSSAEDSALSLLRAWVQSSVKELRSQKAVQWGKKKKNISCILAIATPITSSPRQPLIYFLFAYSLLRVYKIFNCW